MYSILNKILWPVEIMSLLITITALAIANYELLTIGMSTLAVVYFLSGYVPNSQPGREQGEKPKQDFFDLLATSICVRMTWISCSVTLIGALFGLLHLNGAQEMLMIGCLALIATVLIMSIYSLTRNGSVLMPLFYRAVPVGVFGIYMFMNKPS